VVVGEKSIPNTPQIYRRCVFGKFEKKFWWSIPASDDKNSVLSVRFPSSATWAWRLFLIRSSEAKIRDL
jgi:hypothetical protein